MSLSIDAFGTAVAKYGEEQCGDVTKIERGDGHITAILADGLGSGFQANVLASLTARMLTGMLQKGEKPEDAVDAIVETLPKSRARGIGYTAFTLLDIAEETGGVYAAALGTPFPVLLRRGRPQKIDTRRRLSNGSVIREAHFTLKPSDVLTVFSDGVLNAGVSGRLSLGWQEEKLTDYLRLAYRPGISAEKIANLLLSVCNSLYMNKPGDDLSVLTFSVARKKNA